MFLNNCSKRTQKSFNLLKHYCIIRGPNDETIVPVNLAYATYENKQTRGSPPLLLLHGYLASKNNWVSICKRILMSTRPQRKVIAVDLRNHGDSPHSIEHSNSHVVEDVRQFLNHFKIKTAAILGHSYGGMISMILALHYPDLVEKLIIEDIAPKDQTKNLEIVKTTLDIASKISIPAKVPMSTARSLVDQQLSKYIPDKDYRSFLLTQLIQTEAGKFSWRFNVDTLANSVLDTGFFPEIQGKVFEKPTLFMGAENSTFIDKSDEPDIKRYFPQAEFHYIQGAGHVIHMHKPDEFIKICVDFLNKPTD